MTGSVARRAVAIAVAVAVAHRVVAVVAVAAVTALIGGVSGLVAGCSDEAAGDADTAAVTDAVAAPSGTLSVLTYNVHGLPSMITGDDTTARIAQIAPRLDAFDIVGLQEDFIDSNHAVLAAAVTHTTKEHFDDVLPDRAYGSGITTFARFVSLASEGRHFSTCVGLLDHASDCLASKGFLMVRLQLALGVELDVYVTHLEAGGSDEDMAARVIQVDEILAAMAELSAGRALIFMGDTNLRFGDSAAEKALLEHIEAGASLSRVCAAVDCAEPDRIDRIYFRSSDAVTLTPTAWRVVPGFVDSEGVDLSDHMPIEATIAWAAALAP